MAYGITANGFIRKPIDIIRSEKIALARSYSQFADTDFSALSYEGQLLEQAVQSENLLWQELEKAYYSVYANTADGAQLDRIGALSGLTRKPAVSASVTLLFTGTDTTAIPLGFQVQTANGIVFETTVSSVINGDTYVSGQAVNTGTGGLVSEFTITDIVTPVAGIDTCTNPSPSFGGAGIESDAEYRARIISTGIYGRASAVRIKKEIDLLAGVSSCKVFENDRQFQVGFMPANSIEAVVQGGQISEICNKLYELKPAGIQTLSNWTAEPGQIVVRAKQKGTVFYRLILLENNAFGYVITGAGVENNQLGITVFYPAGTDYTDLKTYMDSESVLSNIISSDIIGTGSDLVTDSQTDFTPSPSNSYDVILDNSQLYKVEFSRPSIVYVSLKVFIKKNTQWRAENESQVKQALISHVGGIYSGVTYSGLGIGESILEWKLISACAGISGIADIDFYISEFPVTPSANDPLEIQNNETPILQESNIGIVYV